MLFQRVNRTDPERIFVVVKNSYSTASLSAGQWVAWDLVTDEDGVAVTKISAELRNCVAGVAVETIAHGEYGLLQVWGYRSAARASGGTGNLTSKITEGSVLVAKTSGFYLQAIHSTITMKPYHLFPGGLAMTPTNTAARATSVTTSSYKVFVKCL